MTVVVKVIVDRSMGGGELLERLDVPKAGHGPLSSSGRLVRVFGSIVEQTTAHLAVLDTYFLHCRTVGTQPVRDDGLGPAVALIARLRNDSAIAAQHGGSVPACV